MTDIPALKEEANLELLCDLGILECYQWNKVHFNVSAKNGREQ